MAWSKDWTPYFDRSEQDKYIYDIKNGGITVDFFRKIFRIKIIFLFKIYLLYHEV
jgi:hypothetical protein